MIVAVMVLLCLQAPPTTRPATISPAVTRSATTQPADDWPVWITEYGTRYHRKDCPMVKGAEIKRVPLSKVGSRSPCPTCLPVELATTQPATTRPAVTSRPSKVIPRPSREEIRAATIEHRVLVGMTRRELLAAMPGKPRSSKRGAYYEDLAWTWGVKVTVVPLPQNQRSRSNWAPAGTPPGPLNVDYDYSNAHDYIVTLRSGIVESVSGDPPPSD